METFTDTLPQRCARYLREAAGVPAPSSGLCPDPVTLAEHTVANYQVEWFHKRISDALVAAAQGPKRYVITGPVRHGKSELCSTSGPAWYLGTYPNRMFQGAAHNALLARRFGRLSKMRVESPFFHEAFPDVRIDYHSGRAASAWALNNGSEYFSSGVGGGQTGLGAGLFVVDDPIKNRKQANSALYRETLKDWIRESVLTRLTPTGSVVLSMARWHADDPAGWLLREYANEGWEELWFPAIKIGPPTEFDPRQEGEALWPGMFPLKRLEALEREMGGAAFAALLQGRPVPFQGVVYQLSWFQFYDCDRKAVAFDRVIHSWDTAFGKQGPDNSNHACVVFGEVEKFTDILECYTSRVKFPHLVRDAKELIRRFPPDAVLIENKASGPDLAAVLREETDVAVFLVEPDGDKIARAQAQSGRIEAGLVRLPTNAPWLREFLREHGEFPFGDHDDRVDAQSQGLRWLRRHTIGEVVA